MFGDRVPDRRSPTPGLGLLGPHLVAQGRQTGLAHFLDHGDESRRWEASRLPLLRRFGGMTLRWPFVEHLDLLDKGRIGKIKEGCHFRTHLGGIAIDGLLAAKDEIYITQFANGAGEGGGGGPGVGAGESTIAQQHGVVHSAGQCLPEGLVGLGRSHGENRDACAKAVLDLQGRFHGKKIEGIDDGFHPCRTRVWVSGSIRTFLASGTCLMQTAICMDLPVVPLSLVSLFHKGVGGSSPIKKRFPSFDRIPCSAPGR